MHAQPTTSTSAIPHSATVVSIATIWNTPVTSELKRPAISTTSEPESKKTYKYGVCKRDCR